MTIMTKIYVEAYGDKPDSTDQFRADTFRPWINATEDNDLFRVMAINNFLREAGGFDHENTIAHIITVAGEAIADTKDIDGITYFRRATLSTYNIQQPDEP